MMLILAMAAACLVTTNVAELERRPDLQRACRPGIKAVSITGDHERLVYAIQYEGDWKGREVAHTVAHVEASRIAQESCKILRGLVPAKVCAYQMRDGVGRPVCATEIASDESGTTVCVTVVGEGEEW